MPTKAPFGSWRSPITADLLVEQVVGLSSPTVSGSTLYWVELRPSEAGRQVIVRREPSGETRDVFDDDFWARTLVHEYGGRCYAVHEQSVFFSNFSDQRLYRVAPGGEPEAITPEPPEAQAFRYADPVVSPDGRWLVCVRERHTGGEVINDVVALPTDGSSEPRVLADGHDFFSAPRLSPDGSRLAWLSWDHPRMPWDGTELWEAPVGAGLTLGAARLVAGGASESISQPRYSPQGRLHYISDRSGWWNLYADADGRPLALAPMDAECSGPDWVFGQSSYSWLDDGSLLLTWFEGASQRLGRLNPNWEDERTPQTIDVPFSSLEDLVGAGSALLALAGSPYIDQALVRVAIPDRKIEVICESRGSHVDAAYMSAATLIEFPTASGLTAHALFYAPRNPEFQGPEGERPPLIVMSHGGPTSAAYRALDYRIQFWTSRGLAVVDVDYGGSTGYGRDYRERLRNQWGVVDVDDCVAAAQFLADRGKADPARMAIRGRSAGGYTTLAALTFRDVFAAGASHFGVADARTLAQDTHKFESRYLDSMIGPWPQARELYEQRSPVLHTELLSTPLILFQGLEDKVVPPAQAEAMAQAMEEKGIPYAYLAFEGEQHGFRRAENIRRVAEAELAFYGRVLGFTPADEIEPIEIHHADALETSG